MKNSILILLSFFLISCYSNDKDELKNDQRFYENNNLDDYQIFDKANSFITSNEYELALIELDKIEFFYPSSPYAKKSILVKAYINFLNKDYEKTRALAEMYKDYYPGSEDIIYAYYLEAMTYYVLIKKSEYSQKNTNLALDKFNFILNAYPNSRYEIDILTKIKLINNNLAFEKEHPFLTAIHQWVEDPRILHEENGSVYRSEPVDLKKGITTREVLIYSSGASSKRFI